MYGYYVVTFFIALFILSFLVYSFLIASDFNREEFFEEDSDTCKHTRRDYRRYVFGISIMVSFILLIVLMALGYYLF